VPVLNLYCSFVFGVICGVCVLFSVPFFVCVVLSCICFLCWLCVLLNQHVNKHLLNYYYYYYYYYLSALVVLRNDALNCWDHVALFVDEIMGMEHWWQDTGKAHCMLLCEDAVYVKSVDLLSEFWIVAMFVIVDLQTTFLSYVIYLGTIFHIRISVVHYLPPSNRKLFYILQKYYLNLSFAFNISRSVTIHCLRTQKKVALESLSPHKFAHPPCFSYTMQL
jgi:hypothetical protein